MKISWSDLAKVLIVAAASAAAKHGQDVATAKGDKSTGWGSVGWKVLGDTLGTVGTIGPVLLQPPAAN